MPLKISNRSISQDMLNIKSINGNAGILYWRCIFFALLIAKFIFSKYDLFVF